MRLSMLPIVRRTVEARQQTLYLIDLVEKDDVSIAIGGVRMDEAMTALARPVILTELRARVVSLDRDLRSYGVQVD